MDQRLGAGQFGEVWKGMGHLHVDLFAYFCVYAHALHYETEYQQRSLSISSLLVLNSHNKTNCFECVAWLRIFNCHNHWFKIVAYIGAICLVKKLFKTPMFSD